MQMAVQNDVKACFSLLNINFYLPNWTYKNPLNHLDSGDFTFYSMFVSTKLFREIQNHYTSRL